MPTSQNVSGKKSDPNPCVTGSKCTVTLKQKGY